MIDLGTHGRLAGIVLLLLALACSGAGQTDEAEPTDATSPDADSGANLAEHSRTLRESAVTQPPIDARDQRELGMNYYLGLGLEPDLAQALVWLQRAAEQGEPIAQLTLGVMHLEGQEVPPSKVNAYMWFSLSAEQGVDSAQRRLDTLRAELTAEELDEAERLARAWKPSAPPAARGR
jgi:TPR repeat protein